MLAAWEGFVACTEVVWHRIEALGPQPIRANHRPPRLMPFFLSSVRVGTFGGVPAYEVRSEVESPPVLIPLEKPRGVSEQQRGTYRPTLQLRRGVRQVDGGDDVDASSQRKERPQAAEGRAA